jgi:hypothetical protein
MKMKTIKTDRDLDEGLANHIIQRLAEGGQPPELGIRHINVGNETYLRVLDTEYFGRILLNGSSFKLVEGYFGGGKTHFLFCVRERAWAHGFATSLVELSPQECPYDDSLRVYQAVARGLTVAPASGELTSTPGLTELLQSYADDLISDSGAEMALEYLRRTVRRVPCESHSFRQAVVAFLKAEINGDDTTSATVGAWLSGEPVTAGMVREHGIFESMSRNTAFAMLRSLCQMLVGMGLPGIVLLFDEVDRTMSVGPRRTRAIGDNLRHVIDLCGRSQLPSTLFLYAVPPEFMRNVAPDYPALYQRLQSPIPFSVRSPQAPIIDLSELDLAPVPLLETLGGKILEVFEVARGVSFDHQLQIRNISQLARACVEGEFELNHRRLFVKVFTDSLFRQLAEGEQDIATARSEDLVVHALEDLTSAVEDWDDGLLDDDDDEEDDPVIQ